MRGVQHFHQFTGHRKTLPDGKSIHKLPQKCRGLIMFCLGENSRHSDPSSFSSFITKNSLTIFNYTIFQQICQYEEIVFFCFSFCPHRNKWKKAESWKICDQQECLKMWKRLFSECSPGKRRFPGKSYKNEGLEKMKNAERKFRMPILFIQDGSGGGDSFLSAF